MSVQPVEHGEPVEPEYVGTVAWAEANYPGGYAMNGAGQHIPRPVYDDPATAHLYEVHDAHLEECGFCSELLTDSVCEGNGWHCQDCRDEGNCPACNGAPS